MSRRSKDKGFRTEGTLENEPFITDNGGYIIDCDFGPSITNPADLEKTISKIKG